MSWENRLSSILKEDKNSAICPEWQEDSFVLRICMPLPLRSSPKFTTMLLTKVLKCKKLNTVDLQVFLLSEHMLYKKSCNHEKK